MSLPKVPRWAWAAWAGAGVLLEAVALANKHGGHTLTNTLKWLFGIDPRRWWMPVGVAGLAGGFVWLMDHLYGWW